MPINEPDKIITPWATSGLKDTIPQNADPIDGRAGYDQGFPAINLTPRSAGGIPPFGQDFNGIFFDITEAIQFQQSGGSFPYDSVWATSVGGYPIGAIVSRSDNQGFWRNTVADNLTDPETGGAGWQPEGAGSTAITMTSSNVTMTALQASRSIIIITGTLTTNLQLIIPTYVKSWTIQNNTYGSFTITAKTAAGSGVVLSAGSNILFGDGTDIITSNPTVPDATTTVKGIVELATNAETQAGTDTVRAVTPAALASVTATETRAGLIELATDAEVQSGTDSNLAVTPAGLSSRTATQTRTGMAELATSAEAAAGVDDVRIITPLKLRNGLNAAGSAPIYACRAWVKFNGTGTPAINGSGNVSSITDNGTGNYRVNFTTAMPNENYAAPAACPDIPNYAYIVQPNNYQAGSVGVKVRRNGDHVLTDISEISVAIFI